MTSFNLADIAVGAGLVVGGYFVYLVATKGLTVAVAWVKGWWGAGAAEIATIKGDVASAHAKIATLQADVAAVKTKVGA